MLTLRNVDAGYGDFQALVRYISLDVNAGEAVAVIGPNGAGKTTLMRAISGLIPVTRGQHHHGRDFGTRHRRPSPNRRLRRCPRTRTPAALPAHERRRQLAHGQLLAAISSALQRAFGSSSTSYFQAHEGAPQSDSPAPCPAASSKCARSAVL